jgi:hypothetical protein
MTTSKRTTGRSTAPTQDGTPPPVKVRSRRTKTPLTTAMPLHREDRQASIAKAAYFRSEHRGFQPGYELEDWLAAEEEVDQRLLGEGRAS